MKDVLGKGYRATPFPPRDTRRGTGPSDPTDRSMSNRHLIDSVRYHQRHIADHEDEKQKKEQMLHDRGLCSGAGCAQRPDQTVRHANPKD